MHTSKCLLLIFHDSYSMHRESSFWGTFDLFSSCLPFLLPSLFFCPSFPSFSFLAGRKQLEIYSK